MTMMFKPNDIFTVGQLGPQYGIVYVATIAGWIICEVPEDKLSYVAEFNLKPITDDILKGISLSKPIEIRTEHDDLSVEAASARGELTPVTEDTDFPGGLPIPSIKKVDENTIPKPTAEEYALVDAADEFFRITELKNKIRTAIKSDVKSIEDDMADTKAVAKALGGALLHIWSSDAKNSTSKYFKKIEAVKPLFTDMSIQNAIGKLTSIFSDESAINALIKEKYSPHK